MTNIIKSVLADYRCEVHVCGPTTSCQDCKRWINLRQSMEETDKLLAEAEAACAVKDHAAVAMWQLFQHFSSCKSDECKTCYESAVHSKGLLHKALSESCGSTALKQLEDAQEAVKLLEKAAPHVQKVADKNMEMAKVLRSYRDSHYDIKGHPCHCPFCAKVGELLP